MNAAPCPYCSTPVTAGARFCRACGAEQGQAGEQTHVQDSPPIQSSPPPAYAAQPAAPPQPPSRGGLPTVLVVVLAVLVFGIVGGVGSYFLLVKPDQQDPSSSAGPPVGDSFDDSGGTSTPAASPPAATTTPDSEDAQASDTGYRVAERGAFSMEVPDAWRLTEDDVDKGYGIRNTWTGPDGASVLVDYTREFDGTSEGSARKLRRNASKLDGYNEVAFGPVTLGDNDAFEWRFVQNGEKKVDYFTDACGTGYAVLGAAPADVFETYAEDFRHAAETLDTTC